MTPALPDGHPYDRLVGTFHDTDGLAQWRSVAPETITTAALGDRLVACQLDGGGWVFPVWQFTDAGEARPEVLALWAVLRAGGDRWMCALWLRSPQPELGDRTALDWLDDGRPVDAALDLARAAVLVWAS
jgi:hypothetical protein